VPSASFTFTSTERSATFQCKLDGGAFTACTSPRTVGPLPDGQHTFAVRAIDFQSDVDLTPPVRTFKVDATAPDLTLSGKKKQKLGKAVSVTARSDEACVALASGTLRVGAKRFKLKKVTKSLVAGRKATLKLRLSKKAQQAAKRALKRHRKVVAQVKVLATDAAGNATMTSRRVRLASQMAPRR
jgi:hypothetical protein